MACAQTGERDGTLGPEPAVLPGRLAARRGVTPVSGNMAGAAGMRRDDDA